MNVSQKPASAVCDDACVMDKWILAVEADGTQVAYRCIDHVVRNQWVKWSANADDGHVRDRDGVESQLKGCQPDVRLVDRSELPPWVKAEGEIDAV